MYLIINPGSSTLKYKVFDQELKELHSGGFSEMKSNFDYVTACDLLCQAIKGKFEIKTVGYRVVHGGDLQSPCNLNLRSNIKRLKLFSQFAPLHNPLALLVIGLIQKRFSGSPHYAVFDTSYFVDLPEVAKTIAIDQKVAKHLNIVKFGFHGISHQYAVAKVDSKSDKKVISFHLGAGSSVTAVNLGLPIETSMSFTPADGLVMQTRCGAIDPGVVIYLVKQLGIKRTETLINFDSGLAGMTNSDGDMKRLLRTAGWPVVDDHAVKSNSAIEIPKDVAEKALNKFVFEARKYLGAYDLILGGADYLAFGGKIGYHSAVIRDKIVSGSRFNKEQIKTVEPNEELAIAKIIKERSDG